MSDRDKDGGAVKATERPIDHKEAREIARRLINGSFRRDGERLEYDRRPRFSIPAQRDRDDDLLISTYIEQQAARSALLDQAVKENEALRKALVDLISACDSGNVELNSPEVGGHDDIPPHPWHEEWLHNARALATPSQAKE